MSYFATRAAACLPTFDLTFGQAVAYARSGESINLTAVAVSEQERDDPDGPAVVESGRREFVFSAAAFAPLAWPPAPGDRLIDAAGVEFEVLPQDGNPCWEWADPDRLTARVLCREIVGS